MRMDGQRWLTDKMQGTLDFNTKREGASDQGGDDMRSHREDERFTADKNSPNKTQQALTYLH